MSTTSLMKKAVLLLLLGLFNPVVAAENDAQPNLFTVGDFESETGWKITLEDGAEGNWERVTAPVRSGRVAMRLTKTNGLGLIRMVSADPISVKAGVKYRLRGWFHAENAPLSSLLLFRISRMKNGPLDYDEIDHSAGLSSQCFVVNTPPGQWLKRVGHFETKTNENIHLQIVLYGNPCTVWLDDLGLTPTPYQRLPPLPNASFPYSKEEVYRILEKREAATACLGTQKGHTGIVLNGKAVPPVIFKEEPYRSNPERFAYEAFGKAGIPLAIRAILLSKAKNDAGICEGKGKYRWDLLEKDLMLALRQDPYANLMLELWLYEPYPGWGGEYPDECWRNEKGERGYGLWGNIEGFTNDLKTVDTAANKHWWYPSYCSTRWREDMARVLRDVIAHLMQSPLGKAVAGYQLSGGHDLQFQVHVPDYSPASLQAFRACLQKKYETVENLNQALATEFQRFADVPIPPSPIPGSVEKETPFLSPGLSMAYREFQAMNSWETKDYFAGVAKEASGKPVITSAYGLPGEYEFWPLGQLKNLDASSFMSYYPFRSPGCAAGVKGEGTFRLYHKLGIQELDLRSWTSEACDEVYEMWEGTGLTPDTWTSTYRKLVGISLAEDLGYWYFSMNRYFDDPYIMGQIAKTRQIAAAFCAKDGKPFRPDVCVVRTRGSNRFIRAPLGGSRFSICKPFQEMMFETSGVPYDLHYLADILQRPELQDYKVYVFLHTIYLSRNERQVIAKLLKNKGRTLVWMYDAGYLSEGGKSTDAMSELAGMKIATREQYDRQTPIILSGHSLTEGVLPFQGMEELFLTIMSSKGPNPFYARSQSFWVEDQSALPLARYRENGMVAMAIKEHGDWTSIYLGPPFSLGNDLFHNIAARAGAYVCGQPGQSIFMNGGFISLHGMQNGHYTLYLPPGTKRILDPDTHQILAQGVTDFTLWVDAGKTYWFFLE